MKQIRVSILLILFIPSLYGCVALVAGVAGGAGTAVWLSGKLTQEVNASFDKTINASKLALKSLKLEITKETRKEDLAQIISKYSDGKTVWIDIHKVGVKTSRIEVRAGVLGDEVAAQEILNKIRKNL